MKIGWFLTVYGALGGVRSVIETGNSLIRKGHDFYVIGNVGKHKSSFCNDLILESNHIDFNLSLNDDQIYNKLKNINEFDIVFNQDPVTMGLSKYIKSKLHVVHYCAANGECYEQFINSNEGVRTSCSKLLYDVSFGHDILGKYKKYYIGQGINFDEFRPLDFSESIYRKVRNEDKINILCCGSRGGGRKSNKGTFDIIEASHLLNGNKYNFIYFDLTKQDFPSNFKCIETIHNQNSLAHVYSVADIFVACDYVSAWNCCAGEAMACKKPVICSTKGTQDFCTDGENCLIYEEGSDKSPKLLADSIEKLSNDIDLMNRIKENGYSNISNFSWDKVADNIIQIGKDFKLE